MRISLVERDEQRQGRRSRRKRRKRPQSFETSIALPQIEPRRGAKQSKPNGRRSRVRSQPNRKRLPAAGPSSTRQRIGWHLAGLRLLLSLILIGLIGAIVYTSTAEKFFVYDAQIIGRHNIKPDMIYQAAGVHELNIFWIQPRKVADRIITLEGIKTVHVRCGLPAQVVIKVEEREPVVMWRSEGQGRDWWLDRDGVVLPYHGVVSDTIFVVDSSDRRYEVGDRVEPDGIVRSAQQLAASLPGIRVFFYQGDRGLSFTQMTDLGEWPVYVGDSRDLPRKIQILQALNDYLVSNRIRPEYVDVRWANHPVYGKPGSKAKLGSE